MQMSSEELHTEAVLRVRRAAVLVEAAQHQLEAAAAELSSVAGAMREWSRVCKLCGRLRTEWDRLDAMARKPGRITLDGIAQEAMEKATEKGEGR